MSESEGLRITVTEEPDELVLMGLSGEMDIATADAFSARVADIAGARPTRLVVDLSGLDFVDSNGLNALVQSSKAVEAAHGVLVLAAPQSRVRRLFEVVQLAREVRLEDDVDAAILAARTTTDAA